MKEFKSFYKQVGGNEGTKCNYNTRLDTYGCGCSHDCQYCVSPDTQVLMFNNTVKAIKDIEIGDEIYGIVDGDTYQKFTKAIVTNKMYHIDKAYKITLKNGNELICSANHQWLSNRGWKFTVGEMSGKNRRPYLTTSNKLLGFNSLFNLTQHKCTDDYKKGYLRSVILGDANFKVYESYRDNESKQYRFRLVLKNENITRRVKDYLLYFGVVTNDFTFPMIDRYTKESYFVTAIRTHSKDNFYKIEALIERKDTDEFMRGFLAGIYDAEGKNEIECRRIYNSDDEIINDTETALSRFGFTFVTVTPTKSTANKIVKTIRVQGGVSEGLRFGILTNCIVGNDDGMIMNLALKTHKANELQIASIEEYADNMELIDITTTTRNFIANGVVSHNCYAKSLLDFRNLWNPEEPAVADIEKIKKKIAKLDKNIVIRLGGMTDCFQPCEKTYRVTYETLKALNEARIEYLIVTKSAIIADDEYIAVLDKDLAHIQITVTSTDDELARTYEKASPPSERIRAIEKLQSLGYDVQLRLSPFIPQYINFEKLNAVKCDKILVEFLRVNTWIKKWFDLDYSEYTVKQSGYNHLPLETKKEYLKNITNFKEITVCEDESEAYEYWKKNFNHNPNDCCNLRNSKIVAKEEHMTGGLF